MELDLFRDITMEKFEILSAPVTYNEHDGRKRVHKEYSGW